MDETVPSREAILKAFNRHCRGKDYCHKCKLKQSSRDVCFGYYTYKVLGGEIKLEDSFFDFPFGIGLFSIKPIPKIKPDPKLRGWVENGRWVTEDNPYHSLGMIVEIDNKTARISWARHAFGYKEKSFYACDNLPTEVKPVRFRDYTFEEARPLIGKPLAYFAAGDPWSPRIELVNRIALDDDKKHVLINYGTFETHTEKSTTIDGIPYGVPEIDEEAMKEVNHE